MRFYKYSSTGNDFILIDERDFNKSLDKTKFVKEVCTRKTSVGADGVIFISPKSTDTVSMQYYNADGNEVEMCGNGLRAVGRFCAEQLKINSKLVLVETMNANYEVHVPNFLQIKIKMCDIGDLDQVDVSKYNASYLKVGVPHVVIKSEGLNNFPLDRAKEIRFDPIFENGTNINFYEVISPQEIKVRTYERGVESETLSCGTGVTACSFIYLNDHGLDRVSVITEGGLLQVSRNHGEYFLEGPSEFIFAGELSV
ncbi:MAG: diaminopimelate epimerase [Halobacteriovoraceae bacterium]|nr:diaminopimelate epimerase [Halobacteriovoraceae bacterium]|tara:strand:+ start:1025 stop:1789 length:765 start_codon:yes stop_codon:yes gene_type:complete